ncbi:unnamed protein product [Strongylus vulgaris]|uniref:C2H2-type domain-containing protein n=1 Tax=Strongylus vulgaris TaxID=40348 RepID=A0A3P7LR77_STRVU|nr:unnamed protein product [Strongylus vulgaris]
MVVWQLVINYCRSTANRYWEYHKKKLLNIWHEQAQKFVSKCVKVQLCGMDCPHGFANLLHRRRHQQPFHIIRRHSLLHNILTIYLILTEITRIMLRYQVTVVRCQCKRVMDIRSINQVSFN